MVSMRCVYPNTAASTWPGSLAPKNHSSLPRIVDKDSNAASASAYISSPDIIPPGRDFSSCARAHFCSIADSRRLTMGTEVECEVGNEVALGSKEIA